LLNRIRHSLPRKTEERLNLSMEPKPGASSGI
jgi:hypothetical protein